MDIDGEQLKIKKANKKFFPILTYIITAICFVVFLINVMERSQLPLETEFSKIEKNLFFDFPEAYEQGKGSSWEGIYSFMPFYEPMGTETPSKDMPPFEKISHGEIWRFITPIFLHGGFFHFLFNVIAVLILAPDIERIAGRVKFLWLIVIVAIISNTTQYLMTGPKFLGISGVLMGMLGFIWQRKKVAPWEGYSLSNTVIGATIFMILAISFLQIIEMISKLFFPNIPTLMIANSAHLVGGAVGAILGRTKMFARRVTNDS